MSDETISDAQARRFYAIALNEGGYNHQGITRLLEAEGYDPEQEAKDVPKDQYDELCAEAMDEDRAWKMNRDPATKDMFSGRTGIR